MLFKMKLIVALTCTHCLKVETIMQALLIYGDKFNYGFVEKI